MPVPRYIPEDFDTIMRPAIYAWLDNATALAVVWKNQGAPAPTKPYVALGVASPPSDIGQPWMAGPRAIRIVAANTTLYRVTVSGINYDYMSDADATLAEIRAGLIAALPVNTAQASPHFLDVILLTDVISSSAIIVVSAELTLQMVFYQVGVAEFTVSVDVYSDALESASGIASGLALTLHDEMRLEALRAAGLAFVDVRGERRFPIARDGNIEDRAGFDVIFRAATRTAELGTYIETADLDVGIVGTVTV